jgi:HlyD family secretion protein
MKKKFYIITIITIGVIATLLVYAKRKGSNGQENIQFQTATVTRGKITNTVTATGTLEAIETVEVGTQVSGVIEKIYVDFNSDVKKGQVLAQIDKRPLEAQLEQSKASLDDATAELNYQTATYDRNKALFEKKLISQADFDQVIYSYAKAKASLMNARSSYSRTLINLNYATITSPIDGVVLNRAVDQGQTVAASFNTPTLFSIANDLTQMKVEASVDEADIGQVKKNQRVEFSVDAYPDITFPGVVTEVRLQPVITSNVVTYTVIINAPNPDKKLMPGMTATTTIFVKEADNELLIPMQALKFQPDPQILKLYHPDITRNPSANLQPSGKFSGDQKMNFENEGKNNKTSDNESHHVVWIKKERNIYPVPVEININDGIHYGITAELHEGDTIILSASQSKSGFSASASSSARSPFMPTPPRRRR